MTNLITDTDVRLKNDIAIGTAVKALKVNPNWKQVIDEGFCSSYLLSATRDMVHPNEVTRKIAIEKIQAVEYFKQYLVTVLNIAADAEQRVGE